MSGLALELREWLRLEKKYRRAGSVAVAKDCHERAVILAVWLIGRGCK